MHKIFSIIVLESPVGILISACADGIHKLYLIVETKETITFFKDIGGALGLGHVAHRIIRKRRTKGCQNCGGRTRRRRLSDYP